MARRRDNGTGTIFFRSIDKRWQATVTLPDGSKKNFYSRDKKVVQAKMKALQAEIEKGVFNNCNITVGQWLQTWLQEYKAPSLRPKSYEVYEYLIRLHISPAIGGYMLKDLKTDQLQALYNAKIRSGLSERTVRNIHITIHNALEQAVSNGHITKNASNAAILPRGRKKEIRILTIEEQQKLMQALQMEQMGLAFLLDLSTGLRVGELLALRWRDIDLEKGTLTVVQALSNVKGAGLIFQEPKTNAGKRTIPLTRPIIEALKAYKQQSGHELVFATRDGNPINPRNFQRVFKRILDKAGLEHINLHALRHAFATRMLELNTHPKIVQEILGHKDITTTLNIYTHVLDTAKTAAIAKLETMFEAV